MSAFIYILLLFSVSAFAQKNQNLLKADWNGYTRLRVSSNFDFKLAITLAIGGIIGAIIGTKLTLKTKPKSLKIIFATTSLIAALIMIYEAFR